MSKLYLFPDYTVMDLCGVFGFVVKQVQLRYYGQRCIDSVYYLDTNSLLFYE